ncbi:class I SAM-dependent DNA methyltransferase [Tepidibacillus fermentans]|uniref:Methyltransferase family protein n=1 Tax=Tepidibacillus fermentans TaxID=1281767 RepID=A0A4R3KJC2_9BACI|nr:class I SAM-dependent methyltransferase [Tepidibacillus fermentans]TCS83780.1 methyltransferase family protein [Tepidibacillus fermentans]
MMYNRFAYIYDVLMKDAPYEEWIRFTEEIIDQYQINPNQIIDLGCGTGSIAIPLAKKGYQMIGIDLSEEMLSIAYDKMMDQHLQFPLLQQDMRELELQNQAELIIRYCDSLNYLIGLDYLRQTFVRVNQHLKKKGFFVFDLHSPYKLTHIFANQTFAWNEDDISVIWETTVDLEQLIVEHELTFFVEQDDECYQKFEETHVQQTYPIEKVKQLLEETGFELLTTYGDFQLEPVRDTTERIFYIAQKHR